MRIKNKQVHSEAIGSIVIVGGEFDKIRVEFMGFVTRNDNPDLVGLYLCTDYFAIEMPNKYLDWSSIIWYHKMPEIETFAKKQLEVMQ